MKIRIQNFQPFADTQLEATGFTAIVGPSNLGKSAAIRAIVSALFNRPGEAFVRLGHTVSHVTLSDLPTASGAPMTVKWSKGHNVNEFVIDGETYKTPGVRAPQPLQDAGYRDIWIGDKDRSKGESIRPQVAEQFDRLFLLDRAGSFISDVLSVISRLAVLLRAHQRSSSDLKSQKQMLGIRRKDLDAATLKLDAMSPIKDLHARVLALAPQMDALRQDQALVDVELRPRVTRRALLAPFVTVALPPPTAVPPDVGESYFVARTLAEERARLLPLTAVVLPKAADAKTLWVEADDCASLHQLVAARQQYAPVAWMALPPAKIYPLAKIDQVLARIDKLRELVAERSVATNGHFDAVRALKSARDDEQATKTQLVDLLAELKICPVCDRPMQVAEAATV